LMEPSARPPPASSFEPDLLSGKVRVEEFKGVPPPASVFEPDLLSGKVRVEEFKGVPPPASSFEPDLLGVDELAELTEEDEELAELTEEDEEALDLMEPSPRPSPRLSPRPAPRPSPGKVHAEECKGVPPLASSFEPDFLEADELAALAEEELAELAEEEEEEEEEELTELAEEDEEELDLMEPSTRSSQEIPSSKFKLLESSKDSREDELLKTSFSLSDSKYLAAFCFDFLGIERR
jgi:hypothetical protein